MISRWFHEHGALVKLYLSWLRVLNLETASLHKSEFGNCLFTLFLFIVFYKSMCIFKGLMCFCRGVHRAKLWTAFSVWKGIMNGSCRVESVYGDMVELSGLLLSPNGLLPTYSALKVLTSPSHHSFFICLEGYPLKKPKLLMLWLPFLTSLDSSFYWLTSKRPMGLMIYRWMQW